MAASAPFATALNAGAEAPAPRPGRRVLSGTTPQRTPKTSLFGSAAQSQPEGRPTTRKPAKIVTPVRPPPPPSRVAPAPSAERDRAAHPRVDTSAPTATVNDGFAAGKPSSKGQRVLSPTLNNSSDFWGREGGVSVGDATSPRSYRGAPRRSPQPPPPPPPRPEAAIESIVDSSSPVARDYLAHARFGSGGKARTRTESLLVMNPEFTMRARNAPQGPWTERQRREFLTNPKDGAGSIRPGKAIRGYTGHMHTDSNPQDNDPQRAPYRRPSTDDIGVGPRRFSDREMALKRDLQTHAAPGRDFSIIGGNMSPSQGSPSAGRVPGRSGSMPSAGRRPVTAAHRLAASGQGGASPSQRPRSGSQASPSGAGGTPHQAPAGLADDLNRRLTFAERQAANSEASVWPTSPARRRQQPSPAEDLNRAADATGRHLVNLQREQGLARADGEEVSRLHRRESAKSALDIERKRRLAVKLAAAGNMPEARRFRELAEKQERAAQRREAQRHQELQRSRAAETKLAQQATRARDKLAKLREAQRQAEHSAARKRQAQLADKAEAARMVGANPFVQPVNGVERVDEDLRDAGLIPGVRARKRAHVPPPYDPLATRNGAVGTGTVLSTDEYLKNLDRAVQRETAQLTAQVQAQRNAAKQQAARRDRQLVTESDLRSVATRSVASSRDDRTVTSSPAASTRYSVRSRTRGHNTAVATTDQWDRDNEARLEAIADRSMRVNQVLDRQRELAATRQQAEQFAAAATPASALSFF